MQTGKAKPVRNCGTNKVPRKWGISNGAKTTVAVTLVVLAGLLAFSLLVIGAYSAPEDGSYTKNLDCHLTIQLNDSKQCLHPGQNFLLSKFFQLFGIV